MKRANSQGVGTGLRIVEGGRRAKHHAADALDVLHAVRGEPQRRHVYQERQLHAQKGHPGTVAFGTDGLLRHLCVAQHLTASCLTNCAIVFSNVQFFLPLPPPDTSPLTVTAYDSMGKQSKVNVVALFL